MHEFVEHDGFTLGQTLLVLPGEQERPRRNALSDVGATDVRKRSPKAQIVAVGYGTYVPTETCPALFRATNADLAYLQSMIDRLSDTVGRVAKEQKVAFVDMRDIEGWQEQADDLIELQELIWAG